MAVEGDISEERRSRGTWQLAAATFGRVDMYHLNAGIFGSFVSLPDLSIEEFDRVMAVNLPRSVPWAARRVPPVPRPRQRWRDCRDSLYRQPYR